MSVKFKPRASIATAFCQIFRAEIEARVEAKARAAERERRRPANDPEMA